MPEKGSTESLQPMFDRAVRLHREGKRDEAAHLYESILARQPDHFDALHLLGLTAIQAGRPEEGVATIRKAITLNPSFASAHSNLAAGLNTLGQFAEGLASADRAVALKPGFADAENNRGTALKGLGRFEEAIASYDAAISLKGDFSEVHSNRGIALQAMGRFEAALADFEKVIALQPDNREAHRNRGNVLRALKRHAEALGSYEQAISLGLEQAEVHHDRAVLLAGLGRREEALAAWDRAIALQPYYVEARLARSEVLFQMERWKEVLADIDTVIALRPAYPEAYFVRGGALSNLARVSEALESTEKGMALAPDNAEAHSNSGFLLKRLGRYQEALARCDRAIELKPELADAHSNRGIVLHELGRRDEALAAYNQALALKPDHAQAWSNRGSALHDLQRLEEALSCFDKALALDAACVSAYAGRAVVLQEMERPDEAMASHEQAVSLQPKSPEVRFNRGYWLLMSGNFEAGFRDYEWRHKLTEQAIARAYPYPQWLGEQDISGKSIFIHSEQGLGDTLQFCRYLPLLEKRGAKVLFAPLDPLHRLARTVSPTIELVRFDDKLRPFDYHCYLASLPLALGTRLDTVPAAVPYLHAEPEQVARWKQRIGEAGFKIGISWQGSQRKIDFGRSFPLAEFEKLAQIPGVRLISLQKNYGSEQLATLPAGMSVETLGDDYDAGPDAFVDTAAVMMNLDLVITSDTAIAHLAGALARPTWVVLKKNPDWRWMLDRPDSPWYPTMRLFRQTVSGDWKGPFRAIEREIAEMIGGGKDGPAEGATSRASSPTVPISWGELIDKITILEIKSAKVENAAARNNIRNELSRLLDVAGAAADRGTAAELRRKLRLVNEELWEIEDRIRGKEAEGAFDSDFIALARSVYKRNDRRGALKREINALLGSELVEEKLYTSY